MRQCNCKQQLFFLREDSYPWVQSACAAQAEDVMSKPKVRASFAVVESSENLVNTLEAHKTSLAFPVISVPAQPGEVGDFMGIISRSRCGAQAPPQSCSSFCLQETDSAGQLPDLAMDDWLKDGRLASAHVQLRFR
eukprot:GHRQ01024007.1.p1 GENE.GHRQ01024007.1~~GHRQ01024007.1.p1  ORF type:complete len:136 (-),score=17.38 GHRQ01024007.1:516-923(-)